MKESLLNGGLLWLRVFAGLGIAHHGYGKIFGGHIDKFARVVEGIGFPMPEFFAWAAALSEFGGGLLLAVGLFTHIAALFVFVSMSVAVFARHAADPISVKELALAYWTASGTLMLTGAGGLSLDAAMRKQ